MVATRRFLALANESLSGAAEMVVDLKQAEVWSFALELTLLLTGLADSLRIHPVRGPTLLLTLLDGDRVSKADVVHEPGGATSFAIGRNQAKYLRAVLLRAYRDQIAEVNHIHLEGQSEGKPFDLTVMFELFREPLTQEEIKKLLDDL